MFLIRLDTWKLKFGHSEGLIWQFLWDLRLFWSLFYSSHNFLWEISQILLLDKTRPRIGAFLYKSSNDHDANCVQILLSFLHCASFASLSWMTEHCTTELRELRGSSPQIAYASWWSVTIPKSIRENCRNFTGNYSEMCPEFLRTIRRIFQTLAVKFNISWLAQMARESLL